LEFGWFKRSLQVGIASPAGTQEQAAEEDPRRSSHKMSPQSTLTHNGTDASRIIPFGEMILTVVRRSVKPASRRIRCIARGVFLRIVSPMMNSAIVAAA
jgi:hypothetical protein